MRRAAAVAAGALGLALASSVVEQTRLEVQDWDCPPSPASCARPVVVAGFPFPYISDYHGLSPVRSADLDGAVLGMDRFHPGAFLANVGFYGLVLAVIAGAWPRLRPGLRSRRTAAGRPSAAERRPSPR